MVGLSKSKFRGGVGNATLSPILWLFLNWEGPIFYGGTRLEKYNYISQPALDMILSQLGWDYADRLTDYVKEHPLYNEDDIPFRADFYPEGVKLASSKKAIIVCDGQSFIEYQGKPYISPWEIFDVFGEEGLKDIDNWTFKEERQWLIKKINGDWVKPFTLLTECPFRTSIRC